MTALVSYIRKIGLGFSTILQKGHKFLKCIAVVKCGLPEEASTSAKFYGLTVTIDQDV